MKKIIGAVAVASFSLLVLSRAATTATGATTSTNTSTAWLPTGKLLAYEHIDSYGFRDVFVRDVNGQLIKKISHATEPCLTPDGKSVVFMRTDSVKTEYGSYGQDDLWIVSLEGESEPQRLTNTRDSETSPAVSPDGKTVAFWTRKLLHGGNMVGFIELIGIDGKNRRAITTDDGCRSPSWHPNGKVLCFLHRGSVARVDVTGKNRRGLSHGGSDDYPSYSPDGQWIIFARGDDEEVVTREGGPAGKVYRGSDRIYKMRNTGERNGQYATPISKGDSDCDAPAWSPDGKWIVFMSDEDERSKAPEPDPYEEVVRYSYRLYMMRADGSKPQKLPDVAPDGEEESDQRRPSWG